MSTKTLFFLVPLTLALTQLGRADTITDTTLDVSYTATSTFTPVTDNTYDVFLNIDPTSFSAGSGFLTAITMQFKTGSNVSTSVTLVAAPGGPSDWSAEITGGANSSGCDGSGGASGDVCFQDLSASTVVPGGPYNFEFAVTMPGTDALTATSDTKDVYNTAINNGGMNLGITSMGITIQPSTTPTIPEPGTVVLLSTGLIGLLIASRRRVRG